MYNWIQRLIKQTKSKYLNALKSYNVLKLVYLFWDHTVYKYNPYERLYIANERIYSVVVFTFCGKKLSSTNLEDFSEQLIYVS